MPNPVYGLGAAALAGLLLAGAPAPGAHRYGLTLSPVIAVTHPGRTVTFTATDTGRTTLPLAVTTTQVVRRGGRCVISGVPVTWASATPGTFTLTPGGHQAIRVQIANRGPAGAQDLAVNVTTPIGDRGTVHVEGDVTGQAAVTFRGRSAAVPCLKVAGPGHPWALAGLIVVPAGVGGWWAWTRHRHPRGTRGRPRQRRGAHGRRTR
jgi:hypothetical protein